MTIQPIAPPPNGRRRGNQLAPIDQRPLPPIGGSGPPPADEDFSPPPAYSPPSPSPAPATSVPLTPVSQAPASSNPPPPSNNEMEEVPLGPPQSNSQPPSRPPQGFQPPPQQGYQPAPQQGFQPPSTQGQYASGYPAQSPPQQNMHPNQQYSFQHPGAVPVAGGMAIAPGGPPPPGMPPPPSYSPMAQYNPPRVPLSQRVTTKPEYKQLHKMAVHKSTMLIDVGPDTLLFCPALLTAYQSGALGVNARFFHLYTNKLNNVFYFNHPSLLQQSILTNLMLQHVFSLIKQSDMACEVTNMDFEDIAKQHITTRTRMYIHYKGQFAVNKLMTKSVFVDLHNGVVRSNRHKKVIVPFVIGAIILL